MSDILPDIDAAIAEYGRQMTLRRRVGTGATFTSVAVRGIFRQYQPGELVADIQQGDARAVLGNVEIAAAGWPGPPRRQDQVVVGGRVWVVLGSMQEMLGDTLLVHRLWIREGGG